MRKKYSFQNWFCTKIIFLLLNKLEIIGYDGIRSAKNLLLRTQRNVFKKNNAFSWFRQTRRCCQSISSFQRTSKTTVLVVDAYLTARIYYKAPKLRILNKQFTNFVAFSRNVTIYPKIGTLIKTKRYILTNRNIRKLSTKWWKIPNKRLII